MCKSRRFIPVERWIRNRCQLLTGPGATPVSGTVGYDALTDVATFRPDADLLAGTTYTARLEGGKNGIENFCGKRLCKDYVWRFTTEADTTPPVVIATSPICGSIGVGINQIVSVNFSEPMNPASINNSSFTLTGPGLVPVPGTVSYNDTITNTGPSVVNGDIGLTPGSAVVGFPPGIVVGGTINVNNTAAINAQAALQIAYDDAESRVVNVQPLLAELAGLTLTPGLYNNASAVANSGTLTLDAQGDSNAVFIFQIGSTLTAGVNSQIILAGGAQASNIFWQVGSSATLNTNAIFKGTIMAAVSISTGNGVDVDGRLLAGANDPVDGAVTLINTAVAIPTP